MLLLKRFGFCLRGLTEHLVDLRDFPKHEENVFAGLWCITELLTGLKGERQGFVEGGGSASCHESPRAAVRSVPVEA